MHNIINIDVVVDSFHSYPNTPSTDECDEWTTTIDWNARDIKWCKNVDWDNKELVISIINGEGEWGNKMRLVEPIIHGKPVFENTGSNFSSLLSYCSSRLKDDFDVVMAMVSKNGDNLWLASERLRNNKEIVKNAIKTHPRAYIHCSIKLQENPEIIDFAMNINPYVYHYIPKKFKSKLNYSLLAVKDNWKHYTKTVKHIKGLNKNMEIIKAALEGSNNKRYPPYDGRSKIESYILNRVLKNVPKKTKNEILLLMKEKFQNHIRDWKKISAIRSWQRYAARIQGADAHYLKIPITKSVYCDACKCNHTPPVFEGFEKRTYPLFQNLPVLKRMGYMRCSLAINIVTELHYKKMTFVPTKIVYKILQNALNKDVVEIIKKYAVARRDELEQFNNK